MEETTSNSVFEDHLCVCVCEHCTATMCLLCVHFCMYKTILDFYSVHLFNWYKTHFSSWDELGKYEGCEFSSGEMM